MDREQVPLVRVPREEQYFEREEVLGRDASSVFPTEAKRAAAEGQAGLAELLGANKKFISESELEEIKASRGLRPEDGTIAADKPLAEILREAKEAKEAAFQEQWKQMKTGKNRPLDEEELEFIDTVAEKEAAAARRAREEEEAALAAFHAAQQQQQGGGGGDAAVAAEQQQPGAGAAPAGGQQAEAAAAARKAQPPKKQPLVAIKPIVRPVVRVKSQGSGQAAAGAGGNGSSGPAAKRQRTEGEPAGQQQQQGSGSGSEEGPGLAGLLGGYGSGSESDS